MIQDLVVQIFATKATAVMTNVPGPKDTLYLGGKPIGDIFFWVPQAGRVGIGIAICSYAGSVRIGVGSDAGLVPDPEVIVAGLPRGVRGVAGARVITRQDDRSAPGWP